MEIDRLEVLVEAEAKKANAELDKLIGKLNQVSSAMSKASGLNLGGGKTSASSIKSATSSLSSYAKSTSTAIIGTRSLTAQLTRLAATFYTVSRAVDFMGNSIKKSMDYVETVNLFQTSFKKIGMETAHELGMDWGSVSADAFAKSFIKEAENFNDLIVDRLSLDPEMMKKYQAVFAQMTNSMGLSAKSSMAISESFTMLGNDIASLFNVDTDVAMKKLQSGLAGQIRPLRELGIDISQTSLEMTALNYGIEDNIKDMSQAAKIQLRWLSVMDQAEVAFGDMAKTIESPANQMRVLSQQWANLSRSIGNVFLPIISTTLPYINGFVIALRGVVDTLAMATGYEIPDYSDSNIYKDITGDIEGIEDAADGATEANDKLKKSIMGFDELNILSSNMSKALSGLGPGKGYKELDDAINQKTVSYMEKWNEEMAKMSNKAKEIAEVIQPKIEDIIGVLDAISPLLEGIAVAFATYKIIQLFSSLGTKLSILANTPGLPIALAIGGIAAIYFAIKEYNEKLVKEDLASRFGDIVLSLEDIKKVAGELTTSKYTAKIDVFVSEKDKLSELQKNIKSDIDTLNKLNWKVSVGLGLTPEEISTYKSTIESFITNTEAYIQQQQYVVDLAIDAVVQDDSNFNAEMKSLVDEYFTGSKAEMERLGKDLRAEMDKALADGIIDSTEQKTIKNLIKEINEITSQISDAEFKAKLQMITVDGELTADSFKDLTKEIQSAIDDKLGKEEEAYYTALTYVNVAYQAKLDEASSASEKAKLQKEWDADIAELAKNFSKTKATITLDGLTFSLDTLLSNYKTELDKVVPNFASDTKEALDPAVSGEIEKMDTVEAMGTLVSGMVTNYQDAIANSGISGVSKKGLKEMLDALAPSKDQLQKIYDDSIEAGTQVPDGVSAALTDLANLGAISGNMDDIAFLIGQKLSTDQTFLDLLATCDDAGKMLDDNLVAGLKSGIPDLKTQGNDLVFDVDAAIERASKKSGKDNMPGYANKIIDGYGDTFDKDTTATGSVRSWLQSINDTINNWKIPQISIPLPSYDEINEQFKQDIMNGIKIPNSPPIRKMATGGVPNFGEMFIAREAGPELVGTIGRNSAVVNNDQIVSSVSQGVAGAVANVLVPIMASNRNSSSGEIVMIVDDRELARAVNRGQLKISGRFNPSIQGG